MAFSGFEDLRPDFAQALQAMIAARPGITPFSGFRSPARQAELFRTAVDKYGSEQAARRWVAPPGRSQHGFGQAVDLRFADPSDRAWAHANAANYNLAFPMSWEPWHIEPIGARREAGELGMAGAPGTTAGAAVPNYFRSVLDPSSATTSPSAITPPYADVQAPPPPSIDISQRPMTLETMFYDLARGQNPLRKAFFGAIGRMMGI